MGREGRKEKKGRESMLARVLRTNSGLLLRLLGSAGGDCG